MSNQKYYKNMCDEIHVSPEMFEKLLNMNMDTKILKRKRTMKRWIAIAAVCAAAFLVSNGISFAATGDMWTSKIVSYYGQKRVVEEIQWTIDDEGNLSGISEHGSYGAFAVSPEGDDSSADYEEIIKQYAQEPVMYYNPDIIEKRGKIYFVIEKNKIDITDQLDEGEGECDVTVTLEGEECEYHVIRKENGYSIKLSH